MGWRLDSEIEATLESGALQGLGDLVCAVILWPKQGGRVLAVIDEIPLQSLLSCIYWCRMLDRKPGIQGKAGGYIVPMDSERK